MAFLAFMAPILPGKRGQWDAFMAEITGPRRSEFDASRRDNGVRERTFLQETPMGDMVIVTLEGDDPMSSLAAIANADNDFTRWFVQQVQEIHGFDLRQPPEHPPHLVIDSGAAGEAFSDGKDRYPDMWAQLITARLKPGKGPEVERLNEMLRASEQPGTGLLRTMTMVDQKDPDALYMLPVFESEAKARERESDTRREEALRNVRALMGEVLDGPPQFVDLSVLTDMAMSTDAGTAADAASAETVTVFRRVIDEIINGHSLAAFDELIAPDFVEHEVPPGMPGGREGTRQLFAMLHAAFPDLHAEIEGVIAQGDTVAVRMVWQGTHTGDFLGIPATGKRASWAVYDVGRVKNGQAVEHWGYMDQMALLQQLGVIPSLEQAPA